MTQHFFPGGDESARAGFFIRGRDRHGAERIVFKHSTHPIGIELAFVLADEAALTVFHDLEEIIGGESFAKNTHGQAPDELGLKSIVDEILGPRLTQQIFSGRLVMHGGTESDGSLALAFLDDFLQPGKGSADDEQNVPRVHHLTSGAALARIEHHLHLAADVVRRIKSHFRFLHEFEQRRLHATTTDIATAAAFTTGGELVDLIEINNAVLGELDIAIRFCHQVTDEIIDIAPDITGLAELRGISLHKRHANEIGDVLDEVGLANARGAADDDILLREFERGRALLLLVLTQHPRVVVVIAHGCGEHLFGLVLTNHKTVQVSFDVGRLVMEIKDVHRHLIHLRPATRILLGFWMQVLRLHARKDDLTAKAVLDKILKLPRDLLRRRRGRFWRIRRNRREVTHDHRLSARRSAVAIAKAERPRRITTLIPQLICSQNPGTFKACITGTIYLERTSVCCRHRYEPQN